VKTKRSGLTVIEILVVVGIIALLVGMLLPAAHTVQKMAKETKQRAQFTSIELGLAAFKNDYGDYPPSYWWDLSAPGGGPQNYCGAQKLAEALMGWDLLGFHPNSAWRADGLDASGGNTSYDPLRTRDANGDGTPDTLDERKGRYVDLDTANAFQLGRSALRDGLFVSTAGGWGGAGALAPETYVLCDVFPVNKRKVSLSDGKMVSPGTPILYYKANTASKTIDIANMANLHENIYNSRDNAALVGLGRLADTANSGTKRQHPLVDFTYFYGYIRDTKVHARNWPYRPDSYLLISAGADGLYGTDDDICNFGR